MPLNLPALVDGLKKLMDPDTAGHSFPQQNEVASKWGGVVLEYAQGLIPASSTHQQARVAFEMILASVSISTGDVLLKAAFQQYAVIAAAGQVGSQFTGVPPFIPLDFSAVYAIGNSGGSGAQCAGVMAQIINAWFLTGSAILIPPPNTLVPWS